MDTILKRISPEEKHLINDTLVQEAREQLRILKTKVPIRGLGNGDSEFSRAAVLLDLLVRAHHGGAGGRGKSLDRSNLAKLATLKRKTFQDFYDRMQHHLPPSFGSASYQSAEASSSGKKKRTRMTTARESSPAASTRSASSSSVSSLSSSRPSLSAIQTLSIRLSGILLDSANCAMEAQSLLERTRHYIKSSLQYHHRDGALSDLQQHQAAYEAACLFVVAAAKSSAGNHAGSSGSSLDQSIFIETINITKTKFKSVLGQVRKYVKGIQELEEKQPPAKKSKSKKANYTKQSNSTNKSIKGKSASNSTGRRSSSSAIDSILAQADNLDDDSSSLSKRLGSNKTPREQNSKVLFLWPVANLSKEHLDWEREVLKKRLGAARSSLSAESVLLSGNTKSEESDSDNVRDDNAKVFKRAVDIAMKEAHSRSSRICET